MLKHNGKRCYLIAWLVINVTIILGITGCSSSSNEDNTSSYISIENDVTTLITGDETTSGSIYKDVTTSLENDENTTSNIEDTTSDIGVSEDKYPSDISIRKLLNVAVQPLGSTMYIWGGGWNEEDTAAGPSATMIGVNPQWKIYADVQDKNFDYKEHRYEINNGLDCSGYVGWVMYNVLQEKDGQEGYVYKASTMSKIYSELGLGEYIEKPTEFLAGDIVSMRKHVWICLGTCEDGSVLLIHSSPPGVTISGTPLADGNKSQAQQLAEEYMKKYFSGWYERYPDCSVSNSYISDVTVFRWSDKIMKDLKEYQGYSGEKILQIIFQ